MVYKLVSGHADGVTIKEIAKEMNVDFSKGEGFYQLVKKEKVSAKKKMVLFKDGKFLTDEDTTIRTLCKLKGGDVDVAPGSVPSGHQLFVQSTSANRKIAGDTAVLFTVDVADSENENSDDDNSDGGRIFGWDEEEHEGIESDEEEDSSSDEEESDEKLCDCFTRYNPDVYYNPVNVGGAEATTLHIFAGGDDNYPDNYILYGCTYNRKTRKAFIAYMHYHDENGGGCDLLRYGIPSHFTTLILECCSIDTFTVEVILACTSLTKIEVRKNGKLDDFMEEDEFGMLEEAVQNGRNLVVMFDGECILGGDAAGVKVKSKTEEEEDEEESGSNKKQRTA